MAPVRILLVEDDASDEPLTRRALEHELIRDAVLVARGGPQGLDYLFGQGRYQGRDTAEQPQVVLLDVNGSGPGGLDVLKAIRADHRTSLLPVVILTAQAQADLLGGYQHGANSYVIKPVDGAELAELVGRLARYWLEVNQRPPADSG